MPPKAVMAQCFTSNGHHWSGWPGAHCFKCGQPDPREQSLANNLWHISPCGELIWTGTQEEKEQEEAALVCSVKGVLRWNTNTKKFDLVI